MHAFCLCPNNLFKLISEILCRCCIDQFTPPNVVFISIEMPSLNFFIESFAVCALRRIRNMALKIGWQGGKKRVQMICRKTLYEVY